MKEGEGRICKVRKMRGMEESEEKREENRR
jgi:hypothetical protein